MSEHKVLDHVDEYLKLGREYECSDLHIATAYPPAWRRYGQLSPIWPDHPPLTAEETERLAKSFLGEAEWARLDERGDIDFAYTGSDGRYRASVVKQRLGFDMAFRVINSKIRTMQEIGLPIEHIIPLTRYQNGLILVTGSVGSGKSTSLASIVDFINSDRDDHILTLEDPIEYVFESKGCHVNQREVHKHTESFARALRGALREDPDVIMVGEMRDLETIQLALATELLVNTPAVANCIREGKTFMLPGIMQTGKHVGMVTMDESLRKLYIKGLISQDELLFRSDDKTQMRLFLQS